MFSINFPVGICFKIEKKNQFQQIQNIFSLIVVHFTNLLTSFYWMNKFFIIKSKKIIIVGMEPLWGISLFYKYFLVLLIIIIEINITVKKDTIFYRYFRTIFFPFLLHWQDYFYLNRHYTHFSSIYICTKIYTSN